MPNDTQAITQGVYEHYKSTPEDRKYYQVIMLSRDEIILGILVHYIPMYWNNGGGIYDDGITVWTRTIDNFNETVEYNGETKPRFLRVEKTA
jgi:hypothetical protein